jgi:hypothetical protein
VETSAKQIYLDQNKWIDLGRPEFARIHFATSARSATTNPGTVTTPSGLGSVSGIPKAYR